MARPVLLACLAIAGLPAFGRPATERVGPEPPALSGAPRGGSAEGALQRVAAGGLAGYASTSRRGASIDRAAAERLALSRQRFAYLDLGESCCIVLESGRSVRVRLLAVGERRDSVVGLVRGGTVRVSVDGELAVLDASPYSLPVEVGGVRIQADTTSAWMPLPKRVQLSLWEAGDPVVDRSRFVFPMPAYRLHSHGMQAYNEPVHLGRRDDDPAGQRFYHNYGCDMAGFEGVEEVVCCVSGTVLGVNPPDGQMAVATPGGWVVEYFHLDQIAGGVAAGARVEAGQPVGRLGRRGPSGNFAHLHVGAYLSREHLRSGVACRNLNLYPWLVAAYDARHGPELIAVAGPHQSARTGETVVLDGRRSIPGAAPIVRYSWEAPAGARIEGPVAALSFETPGVHTAVLRVEDAAGNRDVGLCRLKIYSRGAPEPALPAVFMSAAPTRNVRPGTQVRFRSWVQAGEEAPIRVDFGDGTPSLTVASYAETTHAFGAPGVYVVTAATSVRGLSAEEKMKVVVEG